MLDGEQLVCCHFDDHEEGRGACNDCAFITAMHKLMALCNQLSVSNSVTLSPESIKAKFQHFPPHLNVRAVLPTHPCRLLLERSTTEA